MQQTEDFHKSREPQSKKGLSLRLWTEHDLPSVLQIERVSFPSPWKEEFFRQELNNPHSFLWVTEKENAIVGYICAWFILDEGQILTIAVHPNYRNSGIGKFLVEHALIEAKKRCVHTLSLEVRKSNTVALSLYKDLGFQEVSVRKRYYDNEEDALLMVYGLSPHYSYCL